MLYLIAYIFTYFKIKQDTIRFLTFQWESLIKYLKILTIFLVSIDIFLRSSLMQQLRLERYIGDSENKVYFNCHHFCHLTSNYQNYLKKLTFLPRGPDLPRSPTTPTGPPAPYRKRNYRMGILVTVMEIIIKEGKKPLRIQRNKPCYVKISVQR